MILLILLVIASGLLEAGSETEGDYSYPDTTVIAGVFAGYELGDYYHAVFIDDEGYMQTAFPPGGATPGLDVFLFRHRGERVVVILENRQFDLFEAGYRIVPVVIDAWTAEEDYSSWYGDTCQSHGIEEAGEFHALFGNPSETEELFDPLEYIGGNR